MNDDGNGGISKCITLSGAIGLLVIKNIPHLNRDFP